MKLRPFFFLAVTTILGALPALAQRDSKPKLVVGIVVDQMRYDYLYRYWEKYSNDGFKRLLREGFSFENMQYNYAPTVTGPGHAAIYTGAPPAVS